VRPIFVRNLVITGTDIAMFLAISIATVADTDSGETTRSVVVGFSIMVIVPAISVCSTNDYCARVNSRYGKRLNLVPWAAA
jgi:hypothetical protein